MPRTVVLPEWTEPKEQTSPPSPFRPQWSRRLSKFRARYPNTIRRYRLDHQWRQCDLAERIGCAGSTIGSWERGMTMPTGARLLRLAKVLDTLVESLYYEIYTNEKFVVLPRRDLLIKPLLTTPSSQRPVVPAKATIVNQPPTSLEGWWRSLLVARTYDNTIRAQHQHAKDQERLWLPLRINGKPQPWPVSFETWDKAPAHPKSLLMTVRWIRGYEAAKGKPAAPERTRFAYDNFLDLYERHYRALQQRSKNGVKRSGQRSSSSTGKPT